MLIIVINFMVLLIAILHFLFFILETFLWQKDLGRKIFKTDKNFVKKSAALAANQGLYNAFLSAGLIWSLMTNGSEALHLKFFFLSCVMLAGIFGAVTVSVRILLVQAVPAIFTLVLLGSLFI
ncbi:MAG: DUF1304 domain-containing protein [Gammaproteobacteria bacterium]|nr:DUF1304 domain-containing protein [Gammaproteobacteria bacterium]